MRTRRKQSIRKRFESHVKPGADCWLWMGTLDHKGYGVMKIRFDGVPKMMKAHRIAFMLHNGLNPAPEVYKEQFVLHSCDNPPCVNPDHLRLGTAQDNMIDKFKRGRGTTQKLSFQDIREIQAAKPIGRRTRYGELIGVARKYGVTSSHVLKLWKGEHWGYLAEAEERAFSDLAGGK